MSSKANNGRFSLRARMKSFKYAFHGIKTLFIYEHNARTHFLAAMIVVVLGAIVKLSRAEWIISIIVIGAVFFAEIINTAIERLCDIVSPDWHPIIKQVKDLAAAAVLVVALVAAICGIIIFLPKFGRFL